MRERGSGATLYPQSNGRAAAALGAGPRSRFSGELRAVREAGARAEMTSRCPRCDKAVFFAEKVSSLGKNWHRFCLKCERCSKILSAGGHAEHDGTPYCHKPCYAALFGPKGVNIGGVGSYIYDTPPTTPLEQSVDSSSDTSPTTPWSSAQTSKLQKGSPPLPTPTSMKIFMEEKVCCPGCGKVVYFAEKVMSLGRNWHRPCLRCERCKKTLTPGGHAEHDGRPYCHIPCYGYLFGPKGVNIGNVGCYVYEKDTDDTEVASP